MTQLDYSNLDQFRASLVTRLSEEIQSDEDWIDQLYDLHTNADFYCGERNAYINIRDLITGKILDE